MTLTVRGSVRGLMAMVMAMVVSGAMLFAQADARFTGTVLDQSGAAVAGATVVVKDEKTGQERTVLSNAEGRYLVTNLKPSVYTLRATFKDFAPLEYTGMQLVAAQEFSIDLELRPAGLTETVTVQANVSAIDLSSARNRRQRQRARSAEPAGERPADVAAAAAGARLAERRHRHVAGHPVLRPRGRAERDRYDGIEGSAIIDAAPGNVNGENNTPFKLQASLENVQEFRVESNNYPAEYGTGTGGQVSVITKSGSNAFHGALFEYFRDDSLDAPELLRLARATRTAACIAGPRQVEAEAEPVRRLVRRPDRAGIARSSSAATKATASTPGSTSSRPCRAPPRGRARCRRSRRCGPDSSRRAR